MPEYGDYLVMQLFQGAFLPLTAKPAADPSLPGISAAVLRTNFRAEDFALLQLRAGTRRLLRSRARLYLSGSELDLDHMERVGLRVKGCHNLDVLLFEFFGICLIIKKVTQSSFCVRLQGILARFCLHDFPGR